MRKRLALLLVGGMALSGCGNSNSGASATTASGPKVGFVYVSPLKGSGWTQAWDAARKEVVAKTGASTSAVEPIPETADAVGVLKDLVSKGDKVIFATAFGYQPFVQQVAKENESVKFVVIGPWVQKDPIPDNVTVVTANHWIARYALGVLAAKTTKSKTLGFVAANPIPTVIASINAFELGAQSVDPAVQTRAVFTGTWYDPARATQAAQALAQSGADVIAQYEDSTGTLLGAEKSGVAGIGSEADSSALLPKTYLSGTVNNWNEFAVGLVQSVENKTYKSADVLGTISSGVVKLGKFNSSVPAPTQSLVEKVVAGLADGSIRPFTGPISSNTGKVVLPAGATWKDDSTVFKNQNFLVKGVVGTIPG
jgi:basic membrane protein A